MKSLRTFSSRAFKRLSKYFIEKIEGTPIQNFLIEALGKICKLYCLLSLKFESDFYSLSVNGISSKFLLTDPEELFVFKINFFTEKGIYEDLISAIKEDDVFYDIGAHVGTYSCLAAQKIDGGKIFAFEPFPKNVERLKENIQLNGLEVNIISLALSNRNGEGNMEVNVDRIGAGTNKLIQNEESNSIKIRERKGDYLINKMGILPPDVLKIDVEGGELEVLRGLEKNLENCRLIYCEIHPVELKQIGNSPEEIFDLLSDKGFEFERIIERGAHILIKAKKE